MRAYVENTFKGFVNGVEFDNESYYNSVIYLLEVIEECFGESRYTNSEALTDALKSDVVNTYIYSELSLSDVEEWLATDIMNAEDFDEWGQLLGVEMAALNEFMELKRRRKGKAEVGTIEYVVEKLGIEGEYEVEPYMTGTTIESSDAVWLVLEEDDRIDYIIRTQTEVVPYFQNLFIAEMLGMDEDEVQELKDFYSDEIIIRLVVLSVGLKEFFEEAVRWDGFAHFIGTYDGEEVDLDGGLYAYRLE